jgi:hypothetical protein
MYVEGRDAAGVAGWVAGVQALRYKDFCLVGRVAERVGREEEKRGGGGGGGRGGEGTARAGPELAGFREVETVREFAAFMGQRRLEGWWKRAMGYDKDEGESG